jgi:ethanolamine ammonia-lyase small subunit
VSHDSSGAGDPWAVLRAATPARVGLGRAGDALPTAALLSLRAAHARARDAVHTPLAVDALAARAQAELPEHEVLTVAGAAPDRAHYLRRPDLGRRLAAGPPLPHGSWDVVFVLADGLSPRAVQEHAVPTVAAVLERLGQAGTPGGWRVGPLVIATQARVALGDEVGDALGARAVVVLIGERPGLSAADSLGLYLTWAPRPGRLDSERNCVSNVRPPHGVGYGAAAATLVALLTEARRRRLSGVDLKDDGPALTGPTGSSTDRVTG